MNGIDSKIEEATRQGYMNGLRFGIQTTEQADCCCWCQDDLRAELARVQTLDIGVLGNLLPLTTKENWELQGHPQVHDASRMSRLEELAELRGYRKGMERAAHIAATEAAVGRGSRPTARALANRFREEAAK